MTHFDWPRGVLRSAELGIIRKTKSGEAAFLARSWSVFGPVWGYRVRVRGGLSLRPYLGATGRAS